MVDDADSKRARLRACAARLETLDEERRGEHERRAQLVRELRDEGASWKSIARDARRSVARCVAIVAGE